MVRNLIKRKSFGKNAGFSLIEVLVYVFILALILGVVTSSLFSVAKSYRAMKSTSSIDVTAQTVLERMTREIRDARSVSDADSIFNSSPGRISLITTDNVGVPLQIDFYLNNQTLFVEEGGVEIGPLSASSARVSNLVFRKISTGESEALKIEMTVESGQGDSFRSKNFYSSVVLRGSYAP